MTDTRRKSALDESNTVETRNATVAILGAGISGIAMGMELRRSGIDDFTIYEKQPDVGGTWLRNTWPGLHCDVPSHMYCYSSEPNPDWSMTYSGQAEIHAYLRSCAEKHDLIDKIQFNTMIDTARYDEGEGRWILETVDGQTHTHRILVSATGGLAEPKLPKIDGYDLFEGEWWHSAAWRHDVDLTGKRVAVVGSAASAVTVVPSVADVASEVFVFSRSPNWVVPRSNHLYSEEEKAGFRDSKTWQELRRKQYRTSLFLYRAFKRHERARVGLRLIGARHMSASIDDPELIEQLTPDYEPGCKRILVSDDFYSTLAKDHVHLIPRAVTALTANSVVAADGSRTPVDVVIFSTGYSQGTKLGGRAAVDIFGRNGQHILMALAERPEAYRGVAVPGFPNYFTVCGINGVVAYAAFFLSAELGASYIAQLTRRLLDPGLKSIEARPGATRSYNDEIQSELQDMSWAEACTNFYKDASGRVLAFFPGTLGRMRRELRTVHEGDFRFEQFG